MYCDNTMDDSMPYILRVQSALLADRIRNIARESSSTASCFRISTSRLGERAPEEQVGGIINAEGFVNNIWFLPARIDIVELARYCMFCRSFCILMVMH